MRLIDYFDRGADLYPERHCLHDGVRGWSYADVRATTHRVALGLRIINDLVQLTNFERGGVSAIVDADYETSMFEHLLNQRSA